MGDGISNDIDTESVQQSSLPDPQGRRTDAQFVPAWLALLVLVLLLAVMGVGGYVIRGLVSGTPRAMTAEEREVASWREAVEQDPKDLQARVQLGYAYQQAERYDRALDQYEYVLKRDPRNTAALYNRGVSYLKLGLDDKAEAAMQEVLQVQPDHALAAKTLGEMYVESNQYDSLLSAVLPVVQSHPQMADLQYLTGLAYEMTGELKRAQEHYGLALKYSPDMPEAKEGLGRLETKR